MKTFVTLVVGPTFPCPRFLESFWPGGRGLSRACILRLGDKMKYNLHCHLAYNGSAAIALLKHHARRGVKTLNDISQAWTRHPRLHRANCRFPSGPPQVKLDGMCPPHHLVDPQQGLSMGDSRTAYCMQTPFHMPSGCNGMAADCTAGGSGGLRGGISMPCP